MAEEFLSLSGEFEPANEADWVAAVEKALKGKGPDALTRTTHDGIAIKALYREPDHPAATDADGSPVQDVQWVEIQSEPAVEHRILFDPGHGLEERLIREQFQ